MVAGATGHLSYIHNVEVCKSDAVSLKNHIMTIF